MNEDVFVNILILQRKELQRGKPLCILMILIDAL